ncbi:MAG: DUF4390 domain-containing protein [Nitrospinae bacterium]|nr:DUF4390 domain-containing protein [Nitrospinota bacterium]
MAPGLFAAIFFSTFLQAWNPRQAAADAFIVDVVRSGQGERLGASAILKGAFTREIKESVLSGMPMTFTYFIELKRIRSLIWNETSRKLAVKRTVKFDALRKVYLMWEKKGENDEDLTFEQELAAAEYNKEKAKDQPTQADGQQAQEPAMGDYEQMEKWMTRLEGVDMGPVSNLKQGARYYFMVRCEMKSIKLIPPFNYILFFVSLWDFDTEWENSTPFIINGVS